MARGSYSPIDRDRNLIIGYAADELVGQVQDHTIGAVVRPILPPVIAASTAKRGMYDVFRGLKGMEDRGAAGDKTFAAVGQEWFHSVTDRQRAIFQLSLGFKGLASDLAKAVVDRQNQADVQWLDLDVTPTLNEWQTFSTRENASWWTRAATKWQAFEDWADKLKQLRQLARARGIYLHSAEPAALPRTIWEKTANGQGGTAATWLGIMKTVVFTSITILGAISLYGVLAGHRTLLTGAPPAPDETSKRKGR